MCVWGGGRGHAKRRVEGVGGYRQPDLLRDLLAMFEQFAKIRVFQVLSQLALAELIGTARLSHIGQMCKPRRFPAQRTGDEPLPRRVGEMLDRPNHVGDLEIVIVHNAGQMVQKGPVGTLDDMVLFRSPLELDLAPDQIDKTA